ncbi:MAG: hypothetical protein ABIK81_02905 [candidate division WOR-3 bacterium]
MRYRSTLIITLILIMGMVMGSGDLPQDRAVVLANEPPNKAAVRADFLQPNIPKMMNYQGKLTDNSGNPLNGHFDMTFTIYDAATGGNLYWQETQSGVLVAQGIFNVLLGRLNPINSLPEGPDCFLEINIGGTTLSPRQRIVSNGYSYYTQTAEDAYKLGGIPAANYAVLPVETDEIQNGAVTTVKIADDAVNSAKIYDGQVFNSDLADNAVTTEKIQNGTIQPEDLSFIADDNDWVRGTPDSVLYTIRLLGIARGGANNMLHGNYQYTHTNFGIACTTGTQGYNFFYCTIGGGRGNTASRSYTTIGGGNFNRASSEYTTIGGGQQNTASGYSATIAGGYLNNASGVGTVIGGGYYNATSGDYATVGGGRSDSAKAIYCGVFSGYSNLAGDAPADTAATIAGGWDNSATDKYSFVGGGYSNDASGIGSTIAGGSQNTTTSNYATVGGGLSNTAYFYATVSGGTQNIAGGSSATISGGYQNNANGSGAAVGGGNFNSASGSYATVSGGYLNSASGNYATVAGGSNNISSGDYSFTTNNSSIALYSNSAAFNGQTTTASGQTRVGALSKASGTFTIDHPLDPYNKILNHYFVESPEMVNIYRGVAVIGTDGRAVIHLPDYFDALNEKPMIQLTGVGSSDVYVAEKVSGNRFVIGGRPGMEVYWQVTGARKDQSAEITKILMPVEQPKDGELKGRMLDDDFLVSTKGQLDRMGYGSKFNFRTPQARERYENLKKMPQEQEKEIEKRVRDLKNRPEEK